jgi:hypothetical protein
VHHLPQIATDPGLGFQSTSLRKTTWPRHRFKEIATKRCKNGVPKSSKQIPNQHLQKKNA